MTLGITLKTLEEGSGLSYGVGWSGSVRESFWLGRVQSSKDQGAEAKGSLNDAKKGWQDGNVDAPELVNLKHLLSATE